MVNSHQVADEGVGDEFVSDVSFQQGEGKIGDRKANVNTVNRTKHSQTEHRRRIKINERFQILRELIPQNDQKKDKASFLLEVIEYIHFLREKIQMYEGTYQGWNSEPSKLVPWQRNNCAPVENFIDQSQVLSNDSAHEGNFVLNSAVLSNAQNSMGSEVSGEAAYKITDHEASTHIPHNIPLPTNLFDGLTIQTPQGSFRDAEHLVSQSHSQLWHARQSTAECAAPSYTAAEAAEPKIETEGLFSNACSQGLLNSLTHALESSGVDLSQTSICVQLDIGRRTNSGTTSMPFATDQENLSPSNQKLSHYGVGSSGEESDQAHKRLRVE